MNIISTSDLTKEYSGRSFNKDKILALNKFSFNVQKGEIFGLLGPNGAGKTTLVKILLGITFPTTGNAEVMGKDVSDEKYKNKTGYLPENHKFPLYMTGEQVLHYYGMLSGLTSDEVKKRTNEYLSLVDMEKWSKTKIKKYSKGMMQRLGLAQAMLSDPDLIFLDEPTDGVDPIGRKEIRDILLNLKDKGKTIFLNSHLLSEIELMCDRVAILNKGELIKEGTVDELTSGSDSYTFYTSEMGEEVVNSLLTNYSAMITSKTEFKYKSSSPEQINSIIDFLRGKNVFILSFYREKNSLEDMFINLIENEK
ncbi:ABC transporter ATP-binding protein [soil metagenome]